MSKSLAEELAKQYRDATVAEVRCLKKLVSQLPLNPMIVNIGAGDRGISTLAFLEERPDAAIFSIDIHVKANEQHYLRKANLAWRRVVRLKGRSQDIGRHFPGRPHLIYVDGEHTYLAVIEDIEVWWPLLLDGGLMVFHDAIKDGRPSQAGRAIGEMMVGKKKVAATDRIVAFRK